VHTPKLSQSVGPYQNVLTAISLGVLCWLCSCLGVTVFVDPSAWFKALAGAFFFVTLVKPAAGIGAFLLVLPFLGGGRPDELHTIRFITLLSITDLALCLHMLKGFVIDRRSITLKLSHPIAFWFGIYWLVALMSLSSIPPEGLLYVFYWPDPLTAFAFLATNEIQYIYSWKSFSILSLSVLFAIGMINGQRGNEQTTSYWLFCILGGLVASLILGPLDFYDVINLSDLRPPAHTEARWPGYRHARAMSVFGNPGWFAQFCTMATPAVLILLATRMSRRIQIGAIVFIMVLTEFNLLLTQSRGGWLSYPLTLIAVWFAIYVLSRETGELRNLRQNTVRSLRKIIISVPITIAVSVALIAVLADFQKPEDSQQSVKNPSAGAYLARAAKIADTGARTGYWQTVTDMAPLHPFFGAGHDSYGYRYNQFYLFEGAPLADAVPSRTVQGSAHNLYFQTILGRGAAGLLSLVVLLSVTVICGWRFIFAANANGKMHNANQRLVALSAVCSAIAIGIYSNVGEIFYIPANTVLFAAFLATAIQAMRVNHQQEAIPSPWRKRIMTALTVILVAHMMWEYVWPKHIGLHQNISPPNNGCSHLEQADTAEPFRWCGKRFEVEAPVYEVAGAPMALISLRPYFTAETDVVTATIFLDGRALEANGIKKGSAAQFWVPLPADYPADSEFVALKVKLEKAFVPFLLDPGKTNDKRLLSAQWQPTARIPMACYGLEGINLPPSERFRWCPSEFKVSLPVSCQGGACTASMTVAPETFSGEPTPVPVTFMTGGEMLYKSELPRGERTTLIFPIAQSRAESGEIEVYVNVGWGAVPDVIYGLKAYGDPRLLSVQWYTDS